MIRIGIIGCGNISRGHIFRLRLLKDVRLVGFCDINLDRARSLRDLAFPEHEFAGNELLYQDYREMLDNVKMDAVCIFTPHTLHFPQAIYALKMGLHVMVEKPMACSLENAKKMVDEARKRNRVLLVSYQRHYASQFIFLKEMINKGELGQLKMISIRLNQDWVAITRGTWRMKPELSGGGMLMDSGSHIVDLVLWATQLEPVKVYARISNNGYPVDVYSNILLELEGGVIANLSINGNAPMFEEDEVFYGTEGYIRISDKVYWVKKNRETIIPPWLPAKSNPDQNFVNTILGKEENLSPGECGVKVAAVTEVAYESSRMGKEVNVQLD